MISFLFSGIGNHFIPKISFPTIDVNDKINYLLSPRFSILDVLIIIIVAVVIYLALYFLFIHHHKTKNEKMEDELRQFNRMILDDGGIIAEWNPIIDFSGKKGIVGDFQLYCNHHNPPQRMKMGVCPIDECKYHVRRINEY